MQRHGELTILCSVSFSARTFKKAPCPTFSLGWNFNVFRARGEKSKILLVVGGKNLSAASHIRPHEFIGSAIKVPEFELTLSKSEMDERIPNCTRALHRKREIVPTGNEIGPEKIGIANRDNYPRRRFPLRSWFGKRAPSGPIQRQRFRVITGTGALISLGAQALDFGMNRISELFHDFLAERRSSATAAGGAALAPAGDVTDVDAGSGAFLGLGRIAAGFATFPCGSASNPP